MRKQKGFSLIELLIVVAIILIIAAIAIPSLLRARMSANESAEVADSRSVVTAQVTYMGRSGGFADLPCLVTPQTCYDLLGTDPMLDSQIGAANAAVQKSGYTRNFEGDSAITPDANGHRTLNHHATFTYSGVPIAIGGTGQMGYCIDATGLICQDLAGGAACAGPGLTNAGCTSPQVGS